jgi:hypothetical protein
MAGVIGCRLRQLAGEHPNAHKHNRARQEGQAVSNGKIFQDALHKSVSFHFPF